MGAGRLTERETEILRWVALGKSNSVIAQIVGWAKAQGIYVVLDVHQDAWSKYLYSTSSDHCTAPYQPIRGYDGAPRWASPTPRAATFTRPTSSASIICANPLSRPAASPPSRWGR